MSLPDTIFIFALALVIFGPKRLPEIGRQIGKLVYEFRRASNEFKMQIEEELRSAENADRQKQQLASASTTAAAATSEPSNSLTVKPPSTGTMVSAEHPTQAASAENESAYGYNEDDWQEGAYPLAPAPAVTTDGQQRLEDGLQDGSQDRIQNGTPDGIQEDDDQYRIWADSTAPPAATVTTSELPEPPVTATVAAAESLSGTPPEPKARVQERAPEIEAAAQEHAVPALAINGREDGREDLREQITNHHG